MLVNVNPLDDRSLQSAVVKFLGYQSFELCPKQGHASACCILLLSITGCNFIHVYGKLLATRRRLLTKHLSNFEEDSIVVTDKPKDAMARSFLLCSRTVKSAGSFEVL